MESTPSPLPFVRTLRLSGDRRITLTGEIGRGSLGTVYSGTMSGGGARRSVAVKIFGDLPGDDDERVMAGIARVAEAAACVCDPRVVQVYDFELSMAREPFVVTELVDGGSLEMLVDGYARQDRQLPHDVAILVGLKVAEGLAAALRSRLPDGSPANLVHGSLAARDVLVSWGGEVKLKGLGMWRAVLGASMQRPTGGLARLEGTAPEIARGQAPDARSDVFALGMLLRRMLLGPRFSPHTSPAEAIRLVYEGVVHASLHEQQLLSPLRAILKRATAPNPAVRHAHAGEVAADLRRIATLMGIPDVPAFIANAVEDAFAPELSRREAERAREQREDEPVVEAVAEVVDVNGYELHAYGDVVEISPRLLAAPLHDTQTSPHDAALRILPASPEPAAVEVDPAPSWRTMPGLGRPLLALVPPDQPSEPAPETRRQPPTDDLLARTIEAPAPGFEEPPGSELPENASPVSGPLGLKIMPKTPPRPAMKPMRPRQQSGIDFRSTDLDSAPTIVSASPWFDDV
jgi:Protein tyrosine and serine/threonine kinase